MRFSSKNQNFEFNVIEPLSKVKLAVRSYDSNPVVYLDGKKIDATGNCEGLGGFDALYRTSDSFDLIPGQHMQDRNNDSGLSVSPALLFDGDCADECVGSVSDCPEMQ